LHAIAMKLEAASEQGSPAEPLITDFDAALQEALHACERYLAGA
jgi:hypothetical protein